jgi:hypothetical protein
LRNLNNWFAQKSKAKDGGLAIQNEDNNYLIHCIAYKSKPVG